MKISLDLLKVLDVLPVKDQAVLLQLYATELRKQHTELIEAVKECTRRLENIKLLIDAEKGGVQ